MGAGAGVCLCLFNATDKTQFLIHEFSHWATVPVCNMIFCYTGCLYCGKTKSSSLANHLSHILVKWYEASLRREGQASGTYCTAELTQAFGDLGNDYPVFTAACYLQIPAPGKKMQRAPSPSSDFYKGFNIGPQNAAEGMVNTFQWRSQTSRLGDLQGVGI